VIKGAPVKAMPLWRLQASPWILNWSGRERRRAAVLLCECQGTRVRMENSSSRKRWVSRQRGRPRQAPNTVGDAHIGRAWCGLPLCL